MDNITHALVGAAVGESGLKKRPDSVLRRWLSLQIFLISMRSAGCSGKTSPGGVDGHMDRLRFCCCRHCSPGRWQPLTGGNCGAASARNLVRR